MFPLGSLGGFHFRMIWEEELDEEMGSKGTEGSGKTVEMLNKCVSPVKRHTFIFFSDLQPIFWILFTHLHTFQFFATFEQCVWKMSLMGHWRILKISDVYLWLEEHIEESLRKTLTS